MASVPQSHLTTNSRLRSFKPNQTSPKREAYAPHTVYVCRLKAVELLHGRSEPRCVTGWN